MKIIKLAVISCFFFFLQLSRSDDQLQIQPNGVMIVAIGERKTVNEMAVYPQGGIAGRPLLIMAHGNGGSGPQEIRDWLDLAKQHNFTIVCPTFLSAVHSMYIPEDIPYFKDCLRWIEDNLQYDKSNVYMSGVSGGGFAVWYLGTSRPDFFRGLFLQSCNFAGQNYELDLSRWFNKPIKLIWGSEDLPDIPVQNAQAVASLEAEHCKNYSTEVIPGGHHGEHPDMVVTWMEQQVAAQVSN
jgi:pimeloyl-ACP methyl ester carboxylesterase